MQGCKGIWLAGVLAGALLCGGATGVLGQVIQQPYASADSAYSVASDVQPSARYAPQRFVSNSAFGDDPAAGGDLLADLDARLKKFEDKAAADKKKAAGKPSVAVGGRIFADWYSYDQDAISLAQITNQDNGFRFDTVRIFVKGSAFHVMEYKVNFDFAGTQTASGDTEDLGGTVNGSFASGSLQAPTFKDVYIMVKELPYLGHVKVGHFKEPFSLDQLTSSRFITFMERSLPDKPFVPGRNVGVMAYDHSESENMTWAVGAFINDVGDEPPIYADDSGGTAATMRFTWLPWYDEATEGRGLFHLGMAYSYRDMNDGAHRFRSKPEADLGDYIVDTGTVNGLSDIQLIGLEAAFVYGRFRIQSEYFKSFLGMAGAGDAELDGAYAQASWFLTGEQRKYKRTAGTFSDRVKPFENFFRVRTEGGDISTGKGAWELAYRVSVVDLNDAGALITGDDATNHTFGVNWYLNPYARLMLNYINSDLRDANGSGNMNIFALRTQIDF